MNAHCCALIFGQSQMFESHSGGSPQKLPFYSYRINQKWDWVPQFEAYPQLFCSSRDASLLNPGGLIGRYLPNINIYIYIIYILIYIYIIYIHIISYILYHIYIILYIYIYIYYIYIIIIYIIIIYIYYNSIYIYYNYIYIIVTICH